MDLLVPPVKRFVPDGGAAARFPLEFAFRAEGTRSKLAAEYLANEMGREFGVRASRARGGRAADLVVEAGRGLLREVADWPKDRALRDQAYRLIWRPGKEVRILAEAAAGAFYGAVTLRQILAAQSEGAEVPAGVIEDWPALEWRGVQDDLARGRVFNMEHARRQVRRVAEVKGNLYQLYLEVRFAFPRRPDAGMPGSMTPADARELEAYAARFGVTLLPQVNTFGHLELLLAKKQYAHLREKPDSAECICPLHPETRPLLKDLLDDIMDAFTSPLIPVGLDEVGALGHCERCRGRDPGELFLEHVKWLHGVVSARGRRMLMWHDMVLDRVEFAGSVANGPAAWAARVLEALPRDIVICDWQYISTADTTAHFIGKGFPTMACDSTYGPIRREFPFDFSAAWHTSRLYATAARAGALGVIQTNWGDGDRNPFDSKWLMSANALSMAWQPAQRVRLRPMAQAWARIEMGVDGLAYEDFIARLSVPLFGGTGRRSVTAEETEDKHVFRHARSWWRAAGPRLFAHERGFIDDLARRLEALLSSAKRGREYLALLDVPLIHRRIALAQVARVGRAARLYRRALELPAGDARRRKFAGMAAGLLSAYAGEQEAVLAAMKRVGEIQGMAEDAFEKVRGRQAEIRERAARLAGEPLPPFAEVFWPETETPYGR